MFYVTSIQKEIIPENAYDLCSDIEQSICAGKTHTSYTRLVIDALQNFTKLFNVIGHHYRVKKFYLNLFATNKIYCDVILL